MGIGTGVLRVGVISSMAMPGGREPFQNDVRNQMPNMEPKASQLDASGTLNPS